MKSASSVSDITLLLKKFVCAAATMSMSDIAEGFIKHTEQTFGAAHPTREKVKNARRIVVKVRRTQAEGTEVLLCPLMVLVC